MSLNIRLGARLTLHNFVLQKVIRGARVPSIARDCVHHKAKYKLTYDEYKNWKRIRILFLKDYYAEYVF